MTSIKFHCTVQILMACGYGSNSYTHNIVISINSEANSNRLYCTVSLFWTSWTACYKRWLEVRSPTLNMLFTYTVHSNILSTSDKIPNETILRNMSTCIYKMLRRPFLSFCLKHNVNNQYFKKMNKRKKTWKFNIEYSCATIVHIHLVDTTWS